MPSGASLWLWAEAHGFDLPGVIQPSPTVWHLCPQHCCRLWLYPSIPCVTLFPLLRQNQLEAHQDEGMVISHMAVAGVGIWIAFTSGSTLRLFHTETLKHLQDVNIDAPVHSMLPGTPPGGRVLMPLSLVQLAVRYLRRKGKGQQGQQLLMHT